MLFNSTRFVLAAPRDKNDRRESRLKTVSNRLLEKVATDDDTAGVAVAMAAALFAINGVGDAGDVNEEMAAAVAVIVLCNIVAAGLSAAELPPSGTSLSLEPHITRRMGNSFGQLLTKRAVLIALGLAGDGGGSG
jgi:hypothetical protein